MASNQRENERREKQNQKRRKKQLTIWIIIAVIIAAMAIMKIAEIDFRGLFDSVKNPSAISDRVSDDRQFPYAISAGENTVLEAMGNKIAILNDSTYTVINASNAKERIKDEHGYANPVLSVSGGYSVMIDQGSDTYRLDSSTENIYENSVKGEILCADVSDTGVVAIAYVSGVHKSTVAVYGKSLNERMSYEASGGYITSVAIDDRSRRVAFTVTSSEGAKIKSTLYTMDIGDNEPTAKFEYLGSSVLNIHFSSNDLYVVGNDFLSVINSMKNEKSVYAKGSINTVAYCYSPSDDLIIAYGEYVGSPSNIISCVKPTGSIRAEANVQAQIKDVAASGNAMTALTGSEIISFKQKNGKESERIPVDDSYVEIEQMSSKIFGIHSSLLEIVSD